MKTSKAAINLFFDSPKLAIAGVSRNPKKFGFSAMNKLKGAGFEIFLVHPEVDTLHGEKCYRDVSSLPDGIGGMLILTPRASTLSVVEGAVKRGIPNLWIQQMSETPESIEYAVNSKINLVAGQCILMFTPPVDSLHKFHRAIKGFFGLLPK